MYDMDGKILQARQAGEEVVTHSTLLMRTGTKTLTYQTVYSYKPLRA